MKSKTIKILSKKVLIGMVMMSLIMSSAPFDLKNKAHAFSEKLYISVTDTSPHFSEGSNSGHPEYWKDSTYNGRSYLLTYIGGMPSNPSESDCWAKFKPYLSQSGKYDLYAYFYADPTESTKVPYIIHYNGGSEKIEVNQYNSSGWKWKKIKLGTWDFTTDSNMSVEVIDATGEPLGEPYQTLKISAVEFVKVLSAPVDTVPPKVVNTNPANGEFAASVTDAITATFSENIQPGTLSVLVIANKDTNPVPIKTVAVNGKILTIFLESTLNYETGYAVGINTGAVKDLAGNPNPEYSWAFITKAMEVLSPPILISPANGSIDTSVNPTLKWNSVVDAKGYTVQVSKDSNFGTVNFNTVVNTTSAQITPDLIKNTKYFWRVFTFNNQSNPGPWSQIRNFTTLNPQPSCSDKIQNQDETDIDCGGNCSACENGKICKIDSDCQNYFCMNGFCVDSYFPERVTIKGQVTMERESNFKDAIVQLVRSVSDIQTTLTNNEGKFQFSNISIPESIEAITILAGREGFADSSRTIERNKKGLFYVDSEQMVYIKNEIVNLPEIKLLKPKKLTFNWVYQSNSTPDFSGTELTSGITNLISPYRKESPTNLIAEEWSDKCGFLFESQNVTSVIADFYFSNIYQYPTTVWANNGSGGIHDMGNVSLDSVGSCPDKSEGVGPGNYYNDQATDAVLGHTYCVVTKDGSHYAKFRIMGIENYEGGETPSEAHTPTCSDGIKNQNETDVDCGGSCSPCENGTTFIDKDTVLDHDITGSVEITANDITLDCNNYSITGSRSGYGISLNHKERIIIKNCNITNFSYGMQIYYSHANNFINNNISDNKGYGIHLYCSSNNKILENIISFNGGQGISMVGSQDTLIKGNFIDSNSSRGIDIDKSVFASPGAIEVSHNTIIENTISSNKGEGIIVTFCSNNYIYHNNFINNYYPQAGGCFQCHQQPSEFWDNGYPSGGNYWSDFIERFPNAKEIDGSGIWDTFYTFHSNSQDRYPFMKKNGWEAPENQPPDKPTELLQLKSDGMTEINVGATTDKDTIIFKGKVNDPDGDKVKLEVELRNLSEYDGKFNETKEGLKKSELFASGEIASVTFSGLINENYHWRARTIDEHKKPSNWVEFGDNDISEADFVVQKEEEQSLSCKIELRKKGTDEKIDKITVDEKFDIKFTNCSGDIKQVRFLKDELQNGKVNEEFGGWTGWFDWNGSPFDWKKPEDWLNWWKRLLWDSDKKTLHGLSFDTLGKKEVWAEVSGGNNPPSTCFANIEVVPEKFLSVPYYSQGNTKWCVPTSMSMILKYYGKNIHSWDIAKEWEWERDHTELLPLSGKINTYFNAPRLGLSSKNIEVNFDAICTAIDNKSPVLLSIKSPVQGIKHAVVVVGYSNVNNLKQVYISDPSGALLCNKLNLCQKLIAVPVPWDCITKFICKMPLSYAIAVDGNPNPPKGTLDIYMEGSGSDGFYFSYGNLQRVHSWAYGNDNNNNDNGIGWKFSNHPSTLSEKDLFKFDRYITNHTDNEQTYQLEIDFTNKDGHSFPYKLPEPIGIKKRHRENGIMKDLYPLKDLLGENYGEYTITLTLLDDNGKECDKIVFPKIEYTLNILAEDLKKGDLLVAKLPNSPVPGYWSHVGIYDGEGWVVDANPKIGVTKVQIEKWLFPKTWVTYLRVMTADGKTREKAVSFALDQTKENKSKKNKSFDYNWLAKQIEGESYYCSELAWAAYMHASDGFINIDKPDNFEGVSPSEIVDDENTQRIGGHFENEPETKIGETFKGLIAILLCPSDLRVYDSQGRITGLVNGTVMEEIPNSFYNQDRKTVVIFDPVDTYRYEVVGIEKPDEDSYGLVITSVENGETTTFTSSDIPIIPGEVHQYAVDWNALFQGEKGTTLTIDINGDGEFEKTITSDATLEASDITTGNSSNANNSHNSSGGEIISTTPPTNGSIIINNRESNTLNENVVLTMSASNAAQMAISNSPDFAGVGWEIYANSKKWILSSGEGEKKVYAKFRSSSGGVSSVVSDSIILGLEGKVLGATNILDGDIIQCKSSDNPFAVYVVKIAGETKYIRHIVSLEIFNYYGHLKWENLKQVDSLNDYSLSGWVRYNTGENYAAAPTDKVYEINGDSTMHWINMTAEQFFARGGSEPAIFNINQGELNLYTLGVDVMYQ